MNVLQSTVYINDIEASVQDVVSMEKLTNSRVLVTGVTGLVCSSVVDLLVNSDLNVTVYAAGRSEKRIVERFGDSVIPVEYDALCPIDFDFDVDFIIHGASNASPELYVSEPVETMRANFDGLNSLLAYSVRKKVKRVLFVSSSEVYGLKDSTDPFCEDQYGFIDLLNPRSSYSIAKRAAETLCVSYGSEYGVDASIVRLGHVYGPTANKKDMRVSSLFAQRAARREDLILKSAGEQVRSYCYCLDCASALLTVLVGGATGEAYNISNENSVLSIREMAELLAEAGGVSVLFDYPTGGEVAAFNPMANSSLDAAKLEALGWRGRFSAQEGLTHTVLAIRELLSEE